MIDDVLVFDNIPWASGYYWVLSDARWEVVQISGHDMYRTGSDVSVELGADGVWREWGEPLDVARIIGPIPEPAP